jgi:hypothetical protein
MMSENKKTTMVASRVELNLRELSNKKAKLQGTTISKVIRAFLIAWVKGAVPDPPFDMELNDEQDTQG